MSEREKALERAAEHFRHCEFAGTSIEARCRECVKAAAALRTSDSAPDGVEGRAHLEYLRACEEVAETLASEMHVGRDDAAIGVGPKDTGDLDGERLRGALYGMENAARKWEDASPPDSEGRHDHQGKCVACGTPYRAWIRDGEPRVLFSETMAPDSEGDVVATVDVQDGRIADVRSFGPTPPDGTYVLSRARTTPEPATARQPEESAWAHLEGLRLLLEDDSYARAHPTQAQYRHAILRGVKAILYHRGDCTPTEGEGGDHE